MNFEAKTKKSILVDTHVHIYDCYDLHQFLDSAHNNFAITAEKLAFEESPPCFVLLAESRHYDWFSLLQAHSENENPELKKKLGAWRIELTGDETLLRAVNNDGESLFIVSGRQIVTEENLEVLALATRARFDDGNRMRSVVQSVLSADAIPIIPWGVGKWTGRRGKFLNDFLNDANYPCLYLGDVSTRPSFWPDPSHFQVAARRGIRIIAGTDPLPFPSEVWRPGNYGCVISAQVDCSGTSAYLKDLLKSDKTTILRYGKLEKAFRFFRNQFLLRFNRRR